MLRPADDGDHLGAASGPLEAGQAGAPATDPTTAASSATRKRERRRALAVYLGSNAAVITMLLLIPDNSVSKRRPDSLVSFWAAVACAVALFAWVNFSDPGYLDRETAEALAARQRRAAPGDGQPVVGLEMMERGENGGETAPPQEEAEEAAAAGDDDGRMLLEEGRRRQQQQQQSTSSGRRGGGQQGAGRDEGYCKWCDMAKPVRAHHCRVCGLCVSRFDHHCGCLGVCIGERNHCRFWWFILAQNAACLAAIDLVGTAYDPHYRSLVDFAMANLLYLSMSLLLWGMEAFAFILLATHTFFALANLTSYECSKGPERVWYLRGTRDPCDLPFSNGWASNLESFCCLIDGAWAALLGRRWRPRHWERQPVVRDPADVCEHPWQNRYWKCC